MEVARGDKLMEVNKRWGKVLWQEMTRPEFEQAVREQAMVIIPTGSTEQHGPHLPVSCDINNSYSIALEAARRIEDFRLIVAPPVWSGFSPHHIDFPGTISLHLHTFEDLMIQVCMSIYRHGFRKVFILNGHGGNNAPLNSIVQQLVQEKVYVATVTWWNLVVQELWDIGESPLGGMSHACEAETSLQMLLQPQAVNLDARVKEMHPPLMSMAKNDFRESGPIAYGFDFKRQTQHGVFGDPTLATLEKGQRIFDAGVNKLLLALREYYALEW